LFAALAFGVVLHRVCARHVPVEGRLNGLHAVWDADILDHQRRGSLMRRIAPPRGRAAEPRRSAGFADVLRVREFRWLWLAGVQSNLGDQLMRVALSVLVFERTGSAWWTAATYALLYLPALLGGLLLGGLADRFPRQLVLVVGDLARVVLVGCMAVPGVPLGVVAALLVVASLVGSVFGSAEPALVADLFTGPSYTTALSLRAASGQAAQLAGFAAGGLIVAGLGPRPALALDAASFAISAAMLQFGLRRRPAAGSRDDTVKASKWLELLAGARLVASSPGLTMLLAFCCLTALWIVPEGLAVPYADATGGGAIAAGVLFAANPAGNVVGLTLYAKVLRPRQQSELVGPSAILCGLPLIACAWHPSLAVTIVLWALSGVCTAYLVQVTSEYVPAVPLPRRGQGAGVMSAAFLVAQGLGVLAGGGLARVISPYATVACAGAAGSVLAVALTAWRTRLTSTRVIRTETPADTP
jgi:MFS family permease